MPAPPLPVSLLIAAAAIAFVVWFALRLRRSAADGSAEVVVRCRAGHVFRTVWVPFISFKAIRLGPLRLQYCPVGEHLTFVTPVDPARLSEFERQSAALHDDGGMP